MHRIYLFLSDFSAIVSLLPVMVGLLAWKRLQNVQRTIWVLCLFVFAIEALSWGLAKLAIPNLWVYHGWNALEFLAWSYVYHQSFLGWGYTHTWFRQAGWVFVGLTLINAAILQNPFLNELNSNTAILGSIILIGWSIFYYYQLLKQKPLPRLHNNAMVWFNTSVLLYYPPFLFLFIALQYLANRSDWTAQILIVNNTANVLRMSLIAFGLWVKSK